MCSVGALFTIAVPSGWVLNPDTRRYVVFVLTPPTGIRDVLFKRRPELSVLIMNITMIG
jgi:hypothetical protein